jgi:cytochrome P450
MVSAKGVERMTFTFNPFDDATRREPFSIYERARREHPVYVHPEYPIVSIFRYEDIQEVLRDSGAWSNRFPSPPGIDPELLGEPSLLGQDPPEHDRLRSLVNQAFTPRIIRRLEPRLVQIANDLLDEALEKREVDFVEAFTYPLPVIVIAEIIGVPSEDREQFKRWSDAAVEDLGSGLFVPPTNERLRERQPIFQEMSAYFSDLAEERRRNPREDLLSGLVRAEHEGSKLTHEEMITMLTVLLVAGNETTTTLIGNEVLELLDHPDEMARLRARPELIPTAVDEVLRHSSPVQMDPRRATRPAELRGQKIDADQIIVCWLASANRDENVFDDPERFDVGRKDNRHLAFGFGRHFCLGSNLARLEGQVAMRTLLERTKSFERTDESLLPLHPSIVFRGVRSLPLRLVAP